MLSAVVVWLALATNMDQSYPRGLARLVCSSPSRSPPLELARLNHIDAVVNDAIAAQAAAWRRRARRSRRHRGLPQGATAAAPSKPAREPMTVDTVFDLASLTKVVATTTAVMMLVEDGRVRLSDPVAAFIPEFGKYGKERITIRDVLTHMSGLRPDLDLAERLDGSRGSHSTGVGRDAHGRAGSPVHLQRHRFHPARRGGRARVEDAARSVRRVARVQAARHDGHGVQAARGDARSGRAHSVVHLVRVTGVWPRRATGRVSGSDDAEGRRDRSHGATHGRRGGPCGIVQHRVGPGRVLPHAARRGHLRRRPCAVAAVGRADDVTGDAGRRSERARPRLGSRFLGTPRIGAS